MELFGRELSLEQMVGFVECQATPDEDLVHRAALEIIAALRETQRRADAAAEDFTSAAHNGNILCEFCGADCIDAGNDTGGDTCQCGCFEWRGPQEAEKGAAE